MFGGGNANKREDVGYRDAVACNNWPCTPKCVDLRSFNKVHTGSIYQRFCNTISLVFTRFS